MDFGPSFGEDSHDRRNVRWTGPRQLVPAKRQHSEKGMVRNPLGGSFWCEVRPCIPFLMSIKNVDEKRRAWMEPVMLVNEVTLRGSEHMGQCRETPRGHGQPKLQPVS